ncbi:MAG: sugar nucleotide-binding protein [Sphingobium sp.]
MHDLELWGGHECTINRVGDVFRDQTELSGHAIRLADIDLFAELGVSALRYPVLWEKVSPDDPGIADWRWSDERLARLRTLGLRVIAGLLHHGSGPRYTNLLADDFAIGLARHAANVAARYPWIGDWTPVNEPLTTARFSALYGHWYPHMKDDGAFWRALLNQVDGVRLSMKAIRAINPAARLIQTEDLGRTYATGQLRDQAGFENLRRWATWDLLCGRVTSEHPLWTRMAMHGLSDRLRIIADDPVPPDIIGVNHYVTSERFLDHRLHRYPAHTHGGNDVMAYADVESVRVLDPATGGLGGVLREAWNRYRIPLAVTEVHNGCTRDEQMRWMAEGWDTAHDLRNHGVDIRAVTSWSLLGSKDWNTLLTAPGIYEPGAFDVSGGAPRPTAMASLLRSLVANGERHPVVAAPGWWRRPIRFDYPPVVRPASSRDHVNTIIRSGDTPSRPLLICGATGTLGQAFARACDHRAIGYVLTDRRALAVDDPASIAHALDSHDPWAVVNATGWVRVDEAEDDLAGCLQTNVTGARLLAEACAARGIQNLSFSSDLIFDGRADTPYVESDAPNPLNVYGRSKADAERALAEMDGSNLIIRTAAFFSPFDQYNFAVAVVRTLRASQPFYAADDHFVSPAYVPDLVDAALDLLIDRAEGIWHLTNGRTLSWAAFAREIAEALRLDASLVHGVPGNTLGWRARRPVYLGLGSVRGAMLSPLSSAVERFADHMAREDVQALRTQAA